MAPGYSDTHTPTTSVWSTKDKNKFLHRYAGCNHVRFWYQGEVIKTEFTRINAEWFEDWCWDIIPMYFRHTHELIIYPGIIWDVYIERINDSGCENSIRDD